MLYVDIPTAADLAGLATARASGSVSIYLPTTPVNGEISGSRTALKNDTRTVHDQLAAAGVAPRDIAVITDHLDDLADDESFWRFQANSLAIFATADGVRTFRLPNALSPLVEIADRFHIKPLLRAVTFPNTAYVLALAIGTSACSMCRPMARWRSSTSLICPPMPLRRAAFQQ